MENLFLLSQINIDKLTKQYSDTDDHFNITAAPRMLLFLKIKEIINNNNLLWTIKYSPINKGENEIRASIIDPHKKFHFYFAIPLTQKFELKLFLGDNTFNFFEAQPFLIEKGIISDGEFKVSATLNTLPHLMLSEKITRYERLLLEPSVEKQQIINSELFKLITEMADRFVPPLMKVVKNEWEF